MQQLVLISMRISRFKVFLMDSFMLIYSINAIVLMTLLASTVLLAYMHDGDDLTISSGFLVLVIFSSVNVSVMMTN